MQKACVIWECVAYHNRAQKGVPEACGSGPLNQKKDKLRYNVFFNSEERGLVSAEIREGAGSNSAFFGCLSWHAGLRKGLGGCSGHGRAVMPDVAGAIVDNQDAARVQKQGLDAASYIAAFDSYNLLVRLDDAVIVTGDTGTNVGDIIVYVLE